MSFYVLEALKLEDIGEKKKESFRSRFRLSLELLSEEACVSSLVFSYSMQPWFYMHFY